MLVHRRGGRQHAGTHVPDPGHLEQSLQGPVLPERPVQQGEHDVDRADLPGRPAGRDDGQRGATRRDDHGRGVAGDLGQAATGHREALRVARLQHPPAVPRDADRDHVPPGRVQRRQHPARGLAGHGVLTAAAAEDDGDPGAGRCGRGCGGSRCGRGCGGVGHGGVEPTGAGVPGVAPPVGTPDVAVPAGTSGAPAATARSTASASTPRPPTSTTSRAGTRRPAWTVSAPPAVGVGPHRRLDRGMAPDRAPGPWWVVVPVKDTVRGKSRISAPAGVRRAVARALATDTLAAAVAADQVAAVVAVAETAGDAEMAARTGARTVHAAARGLAAALTAGIAAVPAGAPVAVLLGDVPAARPADLSVVLRTVRSGQTAFVRDASGTGTTLLAARDVVLRPRFGEDSAALHLAAGFSDLVAGGGIAAGLRHDVDTLTDLVAVQDLLTGLGSATAALLGRQDVRAALTGIR